MAMAKETHNHNHNQQFLLLWLFKAVAAATKILSMEAVTIISQQHRINQLHRIHRHTIPIQVPIQMQMWVQNEHESIEKENYSTFSKYKKDLFLTFHFVSHSIILSHAHLANAYHTINALTELLLRTVKVCWTFVSAKKRILTVKNIHAPDSLKHAAHSNRTNHIFRPKQKSMSVAVSVIKTALVSASPVTKTTKLNSVG